MDITETRLALLARQTARILLEIEAITLRPHTPFTLTSGRLAPVYVDCRKVISYPRARRAIIAAATEILYEKIGFEHCDAVAGGETAGIPYAAWLAETTNLPMLYVRKKPKGFGRNAQIEGSFPEGARVLLVEDLSTDGGSKKVFVDALRQAGAVVNHVLVAFHNYFDPTSAARSRPMHELGVMHHALANWHDVLAVMVEDIQAGDIQASGSRWDKNDLEILTEYLSAPEAWSDRTKAKQA